MQPGGEGRAEFGAMRFHLPKLRRQTYVAPRQDQTAGEGSQQLQAGRDMGVVNIYEGVSAADVVEITRAEIDSVRRELIGLASRADTVVEARLRAFQDRVVEQFAEAPQLREAFADPDFQFSLKDASRAAVSNDDQHTEDLLIDLLKNRAERGNHARVRLATSHAIRAADKLSLETLHGLTALWALISLTASVPGITGTLASAENVAHALLAMGLTDNLTWTQDADTLNLVRTVYLSTRTPYRQVLTQRVAPYLNPGINLEESAELITTATSKCPCLRDKLHPHPLKEGFIVLPGTSRDEFVAELPVDCEQTPELDQLIAQNGYGQQDGTATTEFLQKINQSDAMSKIADWWDKVPSLNLTVVGYVIGFVNAKRYVQWGGAQTIGELLAFPPA
jgi:hypothetical protein